MIPDIILPGNNRLETVAISSSNYRGLWLPGSAIYRHEGSIGLLTIQESVTPLFVIGYRIFKFLKEITLGINENRNGVFLEVILSGEYNRTIEGDKTVKVKSGQYLISTAPTYAAQFRKGTNSSVFVVHYSPLVLESLGLTEIFITPVPLILNQGMKDLIHDILSNPYEEKLRDFYYENTVRELLFLHLVSPKYSLPGELSKEDIAKIYAADSIMLANLNAHFSIQALSKLAGTNDFKLKKGFRQVFGMGVFARLLHRRMEQAKLLLQTTDKPIWEVGELAGYDSVAAFIKAFRKRFGKTPRQWRLERKKNGSG